ncbi:hypothetical protein FB567DRAFT_537283 [Paraphoma chrysanthemicola]|uniref:Uncharacterized protein n=1 Tax=Paraphoma chrysanthemicola TaxID=798071 RepID=A0A8K0QX03_9PLEO|nr:hypothetical protein FB567DRAFT_537283 [Paraphoma chrysanthemicola]
MRSRGMSVKTTNLLLPCVSWLVAVIIANEHTFASCLAKRKIQLFKSHVRDVQYIVTASVIRSCDLNADSSIPLWQVFQSQGALDSVAWIHLRGCPR